MHINLYYSIKYMNNAIPTKLDKVIIEHIDRLVSEGFYVSRSEAIRDAVRNLIAERYITISRFLRAMAEIAGEIIIEKFSPIVTDVILFGSVATGKADIESDIDLLVLIESKTEAGEMEIKTHEAIYPLSLAASIVFSAIVVHKDQFLNWLKEGSQFALEIVKKGVQIKGCMLDELRSSGLY